MLGGAVVLCVLWCVVETVLWCVKLCGYIDCAMVCAVVWWWILC